MKRAALLLRCSTDAQDYERQKLDLLDTIKGMGYTTSDDLVFGQYITGKDDVWKSHSTLTLLATQNYPFWLKYD